ncbi:MAG: c-type cytochrome [Anaerolineales bacterium]
MRDYLMQCNLRLMKSLGTLLLALALLTACGGESVDPDVARGGQLFTEHCTVCHSLSPEVVIVGPSLAGVAMRAAGESSKPREFLRQSILQPQAVITEGFSDLMPPDFERKLSESDLEALLTYLLTLE